MSELLFIGHGIEVFREGDAYLIRYDAGEIADRLEDMAVSQADAERAMRSERDAYEVIIAGQNAQRRNSN